jgi:hypothetical protein
MANKTLDIVIKLIKQGGGDKDVVSGLVSIKSAIAQGVAIAGAFTAAYVAVDKVLDATVGEFSRYALEVDKFSSALNTSSDEGSRLMQVADKLGIKSEELQKAMFKAVQQGMDPTVDGLAAMADKYNALSTPQEKAEFLQKNFGKASQDLTRLLQQGSQSIREQAASEDELVLSVQDINDARRLEIMQADMADRKKAIQIETGRTLLREELKMLDAIDRMNKADSERINNMVRAKTMTEEEIRTTKGLTDAQRQELENMRRMNVNSPALADRIRELTRAEMAELDATDRTSEMWQQQITGIQGSTVALDALLENEKAEAEVFKDLNKYAEAYHKTSKSLREAEQALADVRRAGWGENSEQVKDAKAKLADLQEQERLETAQFVADALEKSFMVNGPMTEAQENFLTQYRLKTGLLHQEDLDRAKSVQDQVNEQIAYFDSLNGHTINWAVNVAVTYAGTPPPGSTPNQPVGPSQHTTPLSGTGIWTDAHPPQWIPPVYWYGAGGPVAAGMTGIWNEDPRTRPETFISADNGYILTKQDAQAALGGGVTVNLYYQPGISLADERELQTRLQPIFERAIRTARARGV